MYTQEFAEWLETIAGIDPGSAFLTVDQAMAESIEWLAHKFRREGYDSSDALDFDRVLQMTLDAQLAGKPFPKYPAESLGLVPEGSIPPGPVCNCYFVPVVLCDLLDYTDEMDPAIKAELDAGRRVWLCRGCNSFKLGGREVKSQ